MKNCKSSLKNREYRIAKRLPKLPVRIIAIRSSRVVQASFGEVHLIVEPYYEGMPLPETYKFNGQEFKMNVKGTEEVPLEWGGKLVFVNSIVGGSIDARFMPAILKGIMSRMEQGPLARFVCSRCTCHRI